MSRKFSVEEIKKLTKSMVILVDSREKKNSHILDYFGKQRIAYQAEKLEYGDYSFMIPAAAAGEDIYFYRDCVVERMASLKELSGNLTGERERFEKEFLVLWRVPGRFSYQVRQYRPDMGQIEPCWGIALLPFITI